MSPSAGYIGYATKIQVAVLKGRTDGKYIQHALPESTNKTALRFSLLLLICKERRISLMEATLSSKGQATIPKAVRERLHLKPGDRFKFFFHPDGVIILPKVPTSRLKGIIPKPARPVSLEEIDAAIETGATQKFRQKK